MRIQVVATGVEKPAVMVRGIYSTALAKLLLDNGFRISMPSRTLAVRLNLKDFSAQHDAVIRDHDEKEGAVALEGQRAGEIADFLREKLPDAITTVERLGSEIRKGVVQKVEGGASYVDLGDEVGVLQEKLLEGQEVMVSPFKSTASSEGYVQLTSKVRIVGRYADLVKGGWVSVPKGIPQAVARELMDLGHLLKPSDWGIQWKREAARAGANELLDEVQKLKEVAAKVMQKYRESKAPCTILEPPIRFVVLLPYGSKRVLDGVRGLVTATMPGHHMIKSWGRKYAYAVDVVEGIMGILGVEVGVTASKIMICDAFKLGSRVAINHIKPAGTAYTLTPGTVKEFDKENMVVVLKREFKGGGVFDGLQVPKESGDYGISTYRLGSSISKTEYFNEKGELKGVYVNISTPVEFAPKKINYVDLEVDVIAKPNGEVNVVDVDRAERLVKEGIISEALFKSVVKLAEDVAALLENKGDLTLNFKPSSA
ncbi:MAG: DUF402 domain-containing protein [Candidatus Nezhaarchaeota archaeon]|nr:DUF402 domain-containing protein [Candidatus Nezhaarchaeota archaeon]